MGIIWVRHIVKPFICRSFCFDLVSSLFAFSALALAFQRLTRKHCLHVVGLTMRSVT